MKNKLTWVFVFSFLFMFFFSAGLFANDALQLDDDNYYMIHNCSELQNMSLNLTANYKLMNDIDCFDTVNWNDGKGFEPIGETGGRTNQFLGYFESNGYNISGLYIYLVEFSHVGLFSSLGSYVSNLNLVDFNFWSRNLQSLVCR